MIIRRRAYVNRGRVVRTRAYSRGPPRRLVVDTDFGTKARISRGGRLSGRKGAKGYGDGVAVIRDPKTGRIFGRPPRFKMTRGRYAVPDRAHTARGNLSVKEISEKK